MLNRFLALTLCASLVTTGCASAAYRAHGLTPAAVDPATLTDYAQRIPAGSRVRLERTSGDVIRGTMLKVTAQAIVIQKNTRVPEPPVEVPLDNVARLALDAGGGTSTPKAIAIGVAAGAGAFLAILAILAATFND